MNTYGGDLRERKSCPDWVGLAAVQVVGDLDCNPDGVTFIEPWTDWMESNNRCETWTPNGNLTQK